MPRVNSFAPLVASVVPRMVGLLRQNAVRSMVLLSLMLFAPGLARSEDMPLDVLARRIEEFRRDHGNAPGFTDFFQMTSRPGGGSLVARKDRSAAWRLLQEAQQPEIKKADLLALFEATRDAILDLYMECSLEEREYPEDKSPIVQHSSSLFATDAGKVLLRTTGQLPGDKASTVRTRGYDGAVVRTCIAEGATTAGQVTAFESRAMFYEIETNVLFGAMLLDAPATIGSELRHADMKLFLSLPGATVFERQEVVRGTSCVVLSDAAAVIYLDPARNYAVVELAAFSFPDDAPPWIHGRHELSDFADCGNGIWLPRRMHRRRFKKPDRDPMLVGEDIAIVTDLRVNQGIPGTAFSDIIPRGTVVLDGVQNVTYVEGENGSIQSTLDSFSPLRRHTSGHSSFLRSPFFIMSNLIVFALTVFVLAWRFRISRSRASCLGSRSKGGP